MPEIKSTSYGKARVPVMKVVRGDDAHQVWEFVVDVTAGGEALEKSYTQQDNSPVVATDTMKNLVNYLGHEHDFSSLEDHALYLARSFRKHYGHLPRWTVHVEGAPWEPITTNGKPSPISFGRSGPEMHFTTAVVDGEEESLSSGLRDLILLKTTDSAFSDFYRDEFTTLQDAEDRILSTNITAEWTLPTADTDYRRVNATVRETILEIFVELRSESVQHLAHEMGVAILERCEEIEEISLRLPNRHYFLMDLSSFGVENEDTLYLPAPVPHGDIHLTLKR